MGEGRAARRTAAEELLGRLQAISLELGAAMSIDSVATTVVEALDAPVPAPSRSLWLREPGRDELRLIAHRGMPASAAERFASIDMAADVPGAVAARELRTIVSVAPADAVEEFESLRGVPRSTSGFVAIPLLADHTCVGVLGVGLDDELDVGALRFLEAVAAQVAQTVVRVRLTERDQRRRVELEFLANLTETALGAGDHLDLMRQVCAAAVPTLGDWCAMFFLPDGAEQPQVAAAHVDPAMGEYVQVLQSRFPYDPDRPVGVPAVIRTGVTQFVPSITSQVVDRAVATLDLDPAEANAIVEALAITSAIIVALRTKRRVVGAMQFVSAGSGRRYDSDDVALAEAVAGRLAEALEAAWVAEQQRSIAVTLQQALLPPTLPRIAGLDVAARFWPAGSNQVGGDFYDVFALPDGGWGLMIGDACGTGPNAAVLTAIARHTVRAAARHGVVPDEVMTWLNEAVLLSNRDLFCTACYVTLQADLDGASGGRWRMTSTAAGHPLPIATTAGDTAAVGRPGTLLGVLEEIETTTAAVDLQPGDVVILYTDGLTDLTPPFGITPDDLVAFVGGLPLGSSADEIAEALHDALLQRVPDRHRQDDVALLVARVLE